MDRAHRIGFAGYMGSIRGLGGEYTTMAYLHAVAYFFVHDRTPLKDTYGIGIPCETLVAQAITDGVWAGDLVAESWRVPPSASSLRERRPATLATHLISELPELDRVGRG